MIDTTPIDTPEREGEREGDKWVDRKGRERRGGSVEADTNLQTHSTDENRRRWKFSELRYNFVYDTLG